MAGLEDDGNLLVGLANQKGLVWVNYEGNIIERIPLQNSEGQPGSARSCFVDPFHGWSFAICEEYPLIKV